MCNTLINSQQYPFNWLDELVDVKLNPEKNNVDILSDEELKTIWDQLPGEFMSINRQLKTQAFSLYRENHIKVVAGHYDQAIRLLQQQMKFNISQYLETSSILALGKYVLNSLDELYLNMQQRYADYLRRPRADNVESKVDVKLLCRLTVDQIGILLKAADSMQLVVARSFSQVLRTIVPYLSTERFKDISWKSARSSTYKMEENDKEVVLRVLEELKDRIAGF